MKKVELRIGDEVAYTTCGPRADYKYVDCKAIVVAFREDRQGIGLAREAGKGWRPEWVSGQYVMCLWADHLKTEEGIQEAQRLRTEKKAAHNLRLTGYRERLKAVGIVGKTNQWQEKAGIELTLMEETFISLLERLENAAPDGDRDHM